MTHEEYRFSTDETCIVAIARGVTTAVTKVMPNWILNCKFGREDGVARLTLLLCEIA
jgi:hypothetical protein